MGAHDHDHQSGPVSTRARRLLFILLVPALLATVIGLAVLWPSNDVGSEIDLGIADELVDAEVIDVEHGPCDGTVPEAGIECADVTFRVLEGTDDGEEVVLTDQSVTESSIQFEVGDRLVLAHYLDAPEGFQYSVADHERKLPMLVLALAFAVAVVALGGWLGLRALVGMGLGLAVLTAFVLPAILDGSSPLAVALVGSAVVAALAIYLSHGLNARSSTALVGTLVSLALVGLLGWIFIEACEFTGLAAEEAGFVQLSASQISLRGLLLAGFVIGTLGVLDDVTVTQVSAVWELRRANPSYRWLDLYRAGTRIGRDHIASTVNTLVLAYAGVTLPLFILFTLSEQSLADVATGELVAVEIVRTLVGSIGLVASVPVTTALAALVVAGETVRPIGDPRRFRTRTERRLWSGADPTEEPLTD